MTGMNSARGAILAALASLAVTACGATATPSDPMLSGLPPVSNVRPGLAQAPSSDGRHELPPQRLEDGACATFFWTADATHRFVAFENETEGFARIHANGQDHGFFLPPREAAYVTGDPFRRDYIDPGRGLDIRIIGTIGDPLPQGQRIDRTVMRVLQPNGQTLVVPLIGHYACRMPAVE